VRSPGQVEIIFWSMHDSSFRFVLGWNFLVDKFENWSNLSNNSKNFAQFWISYCIMHNFPNYGKYYLWPFRDTNCCNKGFDLAPDLFAELSDPHKWKLMKWCRCKIWLKDLIMVYQAFCKDWLISKMKNNAFSKWISFGNHRLNMTFRFLTGRCFHNYKSW